MSYVTSPRLTDPCAQTLSYTDGITDDLPAICDVLEAENSKRAAASQPQVVLINDSCLAFCVLVHNDGRDGKPSMRALDLTEGACDSGPPLALLGAHTFNTCHALLGEGSSAL